MDSDDGGVSDSSVDQAGADAVEEGGGDARAPNACGEYRARACPIANNKTAPSERAPRRLELTGRCAPGRYRYRRRCAPAAQVSPRDGLAAAQARAGPTLPP